MNILGLSCFYHDAAAALCKRGEVTAAAQEERFSRTKNTSAFPLGAINFCVQKSGLSFLDIDRVAFYEKPYLKFHRVVVSHLRAWPLSYGTFLRTMPYWLQDRLILPLLVRHELGFEGQVVFFKHHLSHAASAYYPSPFDEAAIITADGVGEWATTTTGVGRGREITVERELTFPHSLGLLYTAITTYLGYPAHEGEGTVMGLSALGEPSLRRAFAEIVHVADDGSLAVDPRYLSVTRGRRMYSRRLVRLLGPERPPGAALTQRHKDVAATLQAVVEEALLAVARDTHRRTGLPRLCLAGGTFLNCVANQRILEKSGFSEIFAQPAAGDAGGALGAALCAHVALDGGERTWRMDHAYLGPGFDDEEVRRAVLAEGLESRRLDEPELLDEVVRLVAAGKVVGWFQGRMELGPRALGNRTILGDPRDPRTKERINEKVKHREPFRPFAPIVLEDRAPELFELDAPSPFMLLAPRVRPEARERIPAVTHHDGTARVQTVTAAQNPRLHALLCAWDRHTGVPVLVNTSFNRRGEPIVCTPADALRCFRETGMDALVMEHHLLVKS